MNTKSPRKSARITTGNTGFCFFDVIITPPQWNRMTIIHETKPRRITGRGYNFRTGLIEREEGGGTAERPCAGQKFPTRNFRQYSPAQGCTTVHA